MAVRAATAARRDHGGSNGPSWTDHGRDENFPDPTDRALLESNRNFTLRLRDRDRKLVAKIKVALKRIENGTFGICEGCGGEIEEKRLLARPVTTLCIDCKTDEEEVEVR
jgi:DnaK suppressor protein